MADFWILGGVTLYRRNARNKRIKIKLNTSNDTLRLDYNLSNMKNNSFYKIGFWFLLGVLILFGFLFANGALDGKFLISNPFKNGCEYGGRTYQNGEGFKDTDGCNSCSCVNGQVACTMMACRDKTNILMSSTPSLSMKGCWYNNTQYKDGDSFKSDDECNTCSCNNGSVACTEMACIKNPDVTKKPAAPKGCTYNGKSYENGDSFKDTDGCNSCSCVCSFY